jgi:hypothetical protein
MTFGSGEKPKGLQPDGTYPGGNSKTLVRVDGVGKLLTGSEIANLQSTGYQIEIIPRLIRQGSPHNGRGSRD